MAKQFNDVVTMVRPDGKGGVQKFNALVAQATPAPDGEHLTVIFLDPNLASSSMAGATVEKATSRAFLTPIADGPEGHGAKQYGWEPLELSADAAGVTEQLAKSQDDNEALRKEIAAKVDASAHQKVVDELAKVQDLNKQLTDSNGELGSKVGDLERTVSENESAIKNLEAEKAELEKKLANTTEGRDQALQAIADEGAVKANPTSGDSAPSTSSPEPQSGEQPTE